MIKQEPRSLPTSFHCVQGYGKQQTKETSDETKGEYGLRKSSAEAPNKKGFFMRILVLLPRGHKSSKQLQFLAKFHAKKTVP
jgi:hypothetical protein